MNLKEEEEEKFEVKTINEIEESFDTSKIEMLDVETLDKIEEIIRKIYELTTELFYAIPLDYKGKEYSGRALRGHVNFMDAHLKEIAREFNIEL